MNLGLILLGTLVLLLVGWLVFRLVALDYRLLGRLTRRAAILETLIFALHGMASYLFLDSRLSQIEVGRAWFWLALACLAGGLAMTLVAMARLGWGEAVGQVTSGVQRQGLYGYTRNPQIVGYFFVVAGYALLWPSLAGLLWVTIYIAIAHLMVRVEETHLRNLYGAEYSRYCAAVPRYLNLPGLR